MRFERIALAAGLATTVILAGCGKQQTEAPPPKPTALVDAARITTPNPAEWATYGRTYDEQRFSPLDKIDAGNVAETDHRAGSHFNLARHCGRNRANARPSASCRLLRIDSGAYYAISQRNRR